MKFKKNPEIRRKRNFLLLVLKLKYIDEKTCILKPNQNNDGLGKGFLSILYAENGNVSGCNE